MTARTATERKRAERDRRKARGLTRLELWAKPEHHSEIKALAEKLEQEDEPNK